MFSEQLVRSSWNHIHRPRKSFLAYQKISSKDLRLGYIQRCESVTLQRVNTVWEIHYRTEDGGIHSLYLSDLAKARREFDKAVKHAVGLKAEGQW